MKISPYNDLFKDLEFWKEHYLNENKLYLSTNTLKTYERVINLFIDYCEEKSSEINFSINEINRFIINDFLHSSQVSNSTKSLYLIILQTFLKYISENNDEAVDLLEQIKNIKVKKDKKEIPFYTEEEISKIKTYLKTAFAKTKSFTKKVKIFYIYLLIKTGARAGEIISLSPQSLEKIEYEDTEWLKIKIKGKGSKERFVYVEYTDFISEMVDVFNKKLHKKITYSSLYTFNKNILSKINVKNKGLHSYRHSFARRWVDDNKNLQTLSELLGHQNILTTSKFYAKSSEKGKLKALKESGGDEK